MKLSKKFISLTALTLTLSNCGKEKDESTPDLSSVTSLADLKISSALNLTLPPALSNTISSGASLSLASGKKSSEACRVSTTVDEVMRDVNNVGGFFCHLEVESAKIPFGQKTQLIVNGEEFGRVWADNSVKGQITLYMFQDGALSEKILVTGKNANGILGSTQSKGSEGTQSWANSVKFDAGFNTKGISSVSADSAYSDSADSGSFKRSVNLVLNADDNGLSTVALASKGSWQGSEFSDRGVGKVKGNYGSTAFESSGTYESNTYSFSRRAFFDRDGAVVESDASTEFDTAGSLYVDAELLPSFLANDFAPEAPTGWDGNFDVSIELDIESAEHQACDSHSDDHLNCYGDEFQDGTAL